METTTLSIAANVKAIDLIKSEILSEVARLYENLADFDNTDIYNNISNGIATIAAMDYILARRLGFSYEDIDKKIVELASIAEKNNHELEIAFSDMSDLRKHISRRGI